MAQHNKKSWCTVVD